MKRTGEQRRGKAHWEARVTRCPKGHPYDEANTKVYAQPGKRARRYCRACRRWREATRTRVRTLERQIRRAKVALGSPWQATQAVRQLEAKLAELRRVYPGRVSHG